MSLGDHTLAGTFAMKRGILLQGALPMVFPTISIHESFSHPTSMYLRNLMAMDTEEMVRAQPMDSVVMIGGCDKTLPAQLMAAASADRPTIVLPVGPMLVGHFKGEVLGACTDCRRLWGQYRAGTFSEQDIQQVSERLAPTKGTCMVMGTASTMACVTEAMGMMLPGGAAIPAVHADRLRHAEASGARAVAMAAAGDVVLIAGKGHEDYQIVGTKKFHFDDREVAREAIQQLRDCA